MDASTMDKDTATHGNDFSLPLPGLVVLGPAETKQVAGGFLIGGGPGGRGGGCTTCGLMQPYPLSQVGL